MAEWQCALEGVVMVKPEFWKGRRVFLTGHTGFKGSWMSMCLANFGATVHGFSLAPPTSPSMYEVCHLSSILASTTGDIRDLSSVTQAMRDFNPEIVIHMAAQPLVRESYLNPVSTYQTNVMGTVNVLEACRQCPTLQAIVCVTSDKCYENNEWEWGYRENEPMGGHDPYSNSKGCSELVCSAYRSSYFSEGDGPALASGRAGNVIGGGDWAADRLVPDVITSFSAGREVDIRSPLSIRPWQHVLEPVFGYLKLAEKLFEYGQEYASGWNFGPDSEGVATVEEVVKLFAAAWGDKVGWSIDQEKAPHEAKLLRLDISKAKAQLDWRPVWSLERTTKTVVEWQKAFLDQKNMFDVTKRQIDLFLRDVG